jgi:hypothetical protein
MILSKKPPYAATEADPDKSRMQIDKLLREYGVSGVQWTTDYDHNRVGLAFMVEAEVKGVKKQIGIKIEPPIFVAQRRTWNPRLGRYERVYAPNWAQSFRLLYWWLKAKLEAVAYGLASVEQEFLSQVMVKLPSGEMTTMGAALTEPIFTGSLALEDKGRDAKGFADSIPAEVQEVELR